MKNKLLLEEYIRESLKWKTKKFFNALLHNISHPLSTYASRNPYNDESRQFEKKHNLTGISKTYKFPNNMSSEEFSRDILQMRISNPYNAIPFKYDTNKSGPGRVSKKDLDFIIKNNPGFEELLKNVNFNRESKFNEHILLIIFQGMISKYNEKDIEYFVNNIYNSDFSGWENHHSDEYKRLLEKIKIKIPSADFHWIPSMYTLEKIYAQIT